MILENLSFQQELDNVVRHYLSCADIHFRNASLIVIPYSRN